jgi:membrane protease YdiL (CAAX protease family)
LNPFLSNRRLRPFWRFLLCLPVFIVTEIVAVRIAGLFVPFATESLGFEALYRPLHLLLLLVIFSLMSAALDGVEEGVLPYQGLGMNGPWLNDVFRGLILGSVLVAAAVGVIATFGRYTLSLIPGTHLQAIVLCVWVLATAAMLEEVMFRGYPFQRLVESIGPIAATLIVALFFGAVHLRNPHATKLGALNTVLVGVLFALAYLKTRMLWLPFGIHFAWNMTMGLIFGLPVSGITMFSVVALGSASGSARLTGGAYGIEASLTGTAVIAIGILILTLLADRPSAWQNSATPNGQSGI